MVVAKTNASTTIPMINLNWLVFSSRPKKISIRKGARVIQRGNVNGLLMEPVILADVTNDMAVERNEVFGPVASILPVNTAEEAIFMANDSEHGLSGSIFTQNLERGVDLALQIETGMVHVNDQSCNCEPAIPFGGEKSSGLGPIPVNELHSLL
jgi:vanillin dehydrogenase